MTIEFSKWNYTNTQYSSLDDTVRNIKCSTNTGVFLFWEVPVIRSDLLSDAIWQLKLIVVVRLQKFNWQCLQAEAGAALGHQTLFFLKFKV